MNIPINPVFETKIIRGVFINQSLVVFPQGRMPDNLGETVKFLFGEGAVMTQDCVANCSCIRITCASYVLDNVKTLDAEWTCRKIEESNIFDKRINNQKEN